MERLEVAFGGVHNILQGDIISLKKMLLKIIDGPLSNDFNLGISLFDVEEP